MGYYYRITWPAVADANEVYVTGNFAGWTLSDSSKLTKSKDDEDLEIVVRVDEKQKLVFKFVVDEFTWTINNDYKVERDEHGNANNYIDPDELMRDEQEYSDTQSVLTDKAAEDKMPVYDESNMVDGEWAAKDVSAPENASGETRKPALRQDAEMLNGTGDGGSFLETKPIINKTPSVPISPELSSTISEAFASLDPIEHDAVEEQSSKKKHALGNEDHFDEGDNDLPEHEVTKHFSLGHAADLENILLTESSFTEVSYMTSNSQSAFHHLSEFGSNDEPPEPAYMTADAVFDHSQDARQEGASSLYFEPLASDQVSSGSGNSDYRSEEEVDSIGISIEVEDPGSAVSLPGVFAKIRGLFHF